ncbi:hypothetical protein NMG60_11011964 [Bertholletia excelsa]
MPTPVSTARQCLTAEAAQALDEAAAVARRRGHAQTTSLHAVSALLAPPSSALREALGRARSSAYPTRVQFKALELCLGVALDRLPSLAPRTGGAEPPPVSNSLMAAIKRSQANQRRQPESFPMYQQQQTTSSVSTVKVEIQNLVLSILDDPVVSRVFGEAGFRNCDIKLAIIRPVHQLLRYSYSRYRGPPMFLCNLTGESDQARKFGFPFLGFPGFSTSDENLRRIGEVLVRNKGKSPLLVGVGAVDALHSFCETLEKNRGFVLPVEIYGLNVIRIEKEISKFVAEKSTEGLVKARFQEVSQMVERCLGVGPGVVICFGDLKELSGEDDGSVASASCVVGELTRLMGLHSRKVWLIGAASTHETYLKFLSKFPFAEKDWDLQFLPITSLRPAMADSYPRSSLMESFVPFGGFFSTSSDLKIPFSGSFQGLSCCHLCSEKCEHEVSAMGKGGFVASLAEQYQASLPSWLQIRELGINKGLGIVKAKDDGLALSAGAKVLQRKWDNACQHLHHSEQTMKGNIYQVGSQIPSSVGFQVGNDNENADKIRNEETKASSPSDTHKISTSQLCIPNFPSNMREKTLESEGPLSLSNSTVGDSRSSPLSTSTSVTMDLGLGMYSSTSWEKKKTKNQVHGVVFNVNFDQSDFKHIHKALSERISWQEEAICSISQAIAWHKARNQKRFGTSPKGDIWLTFLGPDGFSKKRIAVALAEILYGSRENFICVDLSSLDGNIHTNTINNYYAKFRGKTLVDYIAEELNKMPLSVVFLENIDKADLLAQKSLSRAVKFGKFPDSHGREVGISSTVFVTTSRFTSSCEILSSAKETSYCFEERILRAKTRPIQMVIVSNNSTKGISNPVIVNKRKSSGTNEITNEHEKLDMAKRAHKASNMDLDLNLPAEEIEVDNTYSGNDSVLESTKAWWEDFVESVDETVVFKPFDYNRIVEKISKEISECFHKIVGSDCSLIECSLEIDSKVMEQFVASFCLSDNNKVEEWIEKVLCKGFVEAQERYDLSSGYIVKLVTCEGLYTGEPESGFCLPPTILVN